MSDGSLAEAATCRGSLTILTGAALVMSTLAACVGDGGVAPSLRAAHETLGAVRVSPLNAIMAVGDTMSLHLTGTTLTGAPLAGFDSVEYMVENIGDTVRVQVSSSGVVTARQPSPSGNPVKVQVIGFKDGLARADLVVVQVTAAAIPNATLSIQPIPPDSARLPWNREKTIIPVVGNAGTGQYVAAPALRYEYGTGDSTTMGCFVPTFVATATLTAAQLGLGICPSGANNAVYGLNTIRTLKKGTAWVYANARVYGVDLRDSVQYTVTNAYEGYVQIFAQYLKASLGGLDTIYVAPGSTVTFDNELPPSLGGGVDWTFDDPSGATESTPPSSSGGVSGNIIGVPSGYGGGNTATRKFATQGRYTWTATVVGAMAPFAGQTVIGTIVVEP